MRTYNPKDVILVVGGRAITGHADDSFIAAEKTEDGFTEYVGAKGEVSVAINANETGMIRITLASTSPSISYLNRLANRREIVSANVIDMNTRRKIGRNDPCPCGSGKKYKKCCLGKDLYR